MRDTLATYLISYIRAPKRGALAGMLLKSTVRFPSLTAAHIWLDEAKRNPELSEFKIEEV